MLGLSALFPRDKEGVMNRIVFVLSLTLVLTACSGKSDGDDTGHTGNQGEDADTDTDADSDTDADADADSDTDTDTDFAPTDGGWDYVEGSITSDNCSLASYLDDEVVGDGEITITNAGAGTFEIAPFDGTDPYDCTLSDMVFGCEERLAKSEDVGADYHLDAVVNLFASTTGSFTTSIAMVGTQSVVAECVGSDCGTAELVLSIEFPCLLTVDFTATAL